MAHADVACRAETGIVLMDDRDPPVSRGIVVRDAARAVGGPVVDDDDLRRFQDCPRMLSRHSASSFSTWYAGTTTLTRGRLRSSLMTRERTG